MERHQLALECVKIEKDGGSVREFLRQQGCISPWGTWHRLQKEELNRTESQITDGRGKAMKQIRLTDEQKAEAVRIAIAGGDPRMYLMDCGSKSPDTMWQAIRQKVKEEDPKTYAKLPGRIPRRKAITISRNKPEKKKVEIVRKLPETAQKVKPPKKEITLKAMEAEGLAGRWRRDGDLLTLDVYRDCGPENAGAMTAREWEAAAAELPQVLKMFGMEE